MEDPISPDLENNGNRKETHIETSPLNTSPNLLHFQNSSSLSLKDDYERISSPDQARLLKASWGDLSPTEQRLKFSQNFSDNGTPESSSLGSPHIRSIYQGLHIEEMEGEFKSLSSNTLKIYPKKHDNHSPEELCETSKTLLEQLNEERRKNEILEAKLSHKEQEIASLNSKLQEKEKREKSSLRESKKESKSQNKVEEETRVLTQEELKTENELLKKKIQEKNTKIEELEKEMKQSSLLHWRSMNEKMNLIVDIEVWKRKFQIVNEQMKIYSDKLEQKDSQLEYYKKELEAKNESNYKMALKLLDYKTKISSTELQLRRFPVKRIYKLYPNADVELSLTKNPSNGVFSVNVLEKGKRTSRLFKSIQSVKEIENRFNVYYTDGGYDTFESNICNDIINSFNEVVSPLDNLISSPNSNQETTPEKK